MKLIYLIREFILIYFVDLINFLYPLRKNSSPVIGEIFYEAHLFAEINKLLKSKLNLFREKKLLPKQLGIGLSERIVEIPWVLSHLTKKGNHLDAGSSLNFRDIILSSIFRDKNVFIVNLNPEKNCYINASISYIFGDLRKKIFVSEFFDSISCVSVLEHVGMDNSGYSKDPRYKEKKKNEHLLVIDEFKRILKKDGVCLISVPFGKYKDHDWLQIFNKKMVTDIIRTFKPSSYDIDYYKYDEKGWKQSTEKECENSGYSKGYPGKDYCVGSYSVACIKLVN